MHKYQRPCITYCWGLNTTLNSMIGIGMGELLNLSSEASPPAGSEIETPPAGVVVRANQYNFLDPCILLPTDQREKVHLNIQPFDNSWRRIKGTIHEPQ